MTHGMSEDDVKKKLYGEFGGIKRAPEKNTDSGKPKEHAAKKIIKRRPIPIKPVIIIVCIIIFLLMLSASIRSCRRSHDGSYSQIKGYLSQGKKYYSEGMYEEAILTWKNVLTIDPANRSASRYIQKAELKKKELKIREEEIARKLKQMLARREKEEAEKKQKQYQKKSAKPVKADVKNVPEEVSAPKKMLPQYTVQVATYVDEASAKELAKSLSGKGFKNASVSRVSSKTGRDWYCAYLGPFSSKDEAEKEMQKIKKEGFSDAFVKTLK